MSTQEELPSFGSVDQDREHGILSVETGDGTCRLTLLERNERGFPRRELAWLPAAVWREVATDAQRELLRGMDELEKGAREAKFHTGDQAMSPLVLRELAILFWALMEDGEATHTELLLAGWRQLAREERWWLYSRASNPSQALGRGWRRALFFALAEPGDMRSAPRLLEIVESAAAKKKLYPPSRSTTAKAFASFGKPQRTLQRSQHRQNARKPQPPPDPTRPFLTSYANSSRNPIPHRSTFAGELSGARCERRQGSFHLGQMVGCQAGRSHEGDRSRLVV